ncbi:hypothetical protein KP509_08G060600 [Ceratopteris richardii]|uniref:Uncharacterized protein n=1 Tax=Ceratopteris richardii TaxID=49495 RepID=A0A8T2UCR3_CERRI|nr:hypothetical protein KP509_08G060600 [Ceratopteris richardii]
MTTVHFRHPRQRVYAGPAADKIEKSGRRVRTDNSGRSRQSSQLGTVDMEDVKAVAVGKQSDNTERWQEISRRGSRERTQGSRRGETERLTIYKWGWRERL